MPGKPIAPTDNTLDQLKYELERDKLKFETDKEKRHHVLEEKKLKHSGRDRYVRVFASVFIPVLLTGGLTFYGMLYEERRATEEAETRKAGMIIQLINAREKAHNDLRASMFKTLIDFYQKDPKGMSGVLLLELVGLNFRDTVLLKPVFEKLNQDPNLDKTQRKALRKASRTMVKNQLDAIRQARDGYVCKLELNVNETDSPRCFPSLTVSLLTSNENQVTLQTNSMDGFLREENDMKNGDKFDVNYFDMPMIDYTIAKTTMNETRRYSVVLEESSEKGAIIVVAVLPVESYSAQMPYRFDEIMADLINSEPEGE